MSNYFSTLFKSSKKDDNNNPLPTSGEGKSRNPFAATSTKKTQQNDNQEEYDQRLSKFNNIQPDQFPKRIEQVLNHALPHDFGQMVNFLSLSQKQKQKNLAKKEEAEKRKDDELIKKKIAEKQQLYGLYDSPKNPLNRPSEQEPPKAKPFPQGYEESHSSKKSEEYSYEESSSCITPIPQALWQKNISDERINTPTASEIIAVPSLSSRQQPARSDIPYEDYIQKSPSKSPHPTHYDPLFAFPESAHSPDSSNHAPASTKAYSELSPKLKQTTPASLRKPETQVESELSSGEGYTALANPSTQKKKANEASFNTSGSSFASIPVQSESKYSQLPSTSLKEASPDQKAQPETQAYDEQNSGEGYTALANPSTQKKKANEIGFNTTGSFSASTNSMNANQDISSELEFDQTKLFGPETSGAYVERYPILIGIKNEDLKKHLDNFEIGDWNEKFQTVVETRSNFVPNTSRHQRLAVSLMFINLARDFIYNATTYSKIIITEQFLPYEKKTIRPTTTFGGIAGGEKYIVGNILFKFATDSFGLYGSDKSAAKVADHELKGASACFNASVGLSVPFVCTLEYLGFKIIATSILPINKTTIVNGSADAGRTVFNTDPSFFQLTENLAKKLNLCSHICGIDSQETLWTACDTEGHRGLDGRFYLLDFSRVFPPVKPEVEFKGGHLYRLFRPEFVRKYDKPLCSDGFSNFIQYDPKYREHNDRLIEATEHLTQTLIPTVAGELDSYVIEALSSRTIATLQLTHFIHSKGINLRYLGLLRQYCKNEKAKMILLLEILVRTIKHDVNLKLRERARYLKSVVEEPHRRVIIDILNRLYSVKPTQKNDYWEHIYKLAPQYFPDSIDEKEKRYLNYQIFGTTFHNPYGKATQPARHLMIQAIQNALFQEPFQDDECLIFKLSDSKSNRARIYSLVGGIIRQGAGLLSPKATVSMHLDDLTRILTAQSPCTEFEKAKSIEVEGNREIAYSRLKKILDRASRPAFMFSEETFLYDGRFLLLSGLAKALSLKFSFPLNPNDYHKSSLRQRLFLAKVPFGLAELEEISMKTKCINVIADSAGIIFNHLGEVYSEVRYEYASLQAREHYQTALEKYNEAIQVDPFSKESLRGAAKSLRGINRTFLHVDNREMENDRIANWKKAKHYLYEALKIDPQDPGTYLEVADLFFQEKKNTLAEAFYIKTLEVDPNYLNALRAYAKFIAKIHSPIQAKPFYQRMNQLLEQLQHSKNLISTHSGDIMELSGHDDMPLHNFF